MKLLLYIFSCTVFLLTACGNPSGTEINDEDYFPSTLTNYWNYVRNGSIDTLSSTFNISGQLNVLVTNRWDIGSCLRIELTTAGADTYYIAGVDTIGPIPLGGIEWFRMDENGVWLYSDTLMQDSVWLAKFPLLTGDSWSFDTGSSATASVVSKSESITVPDGSFNNVLHIRVIDDGPPTIQTDYYYAPDVGSILTETEVIVQQEVIFELTEELDSHFVI